MAADDRPTAAGLSRRAALARLGLGAAAVYAAPTVTSLTPAHAKKSGSAPSPSSFCSGSSSCKAGGKKSKKSGKGGKWKSSKNGKK